MTSRYREWAVPGTGNVVACRWQQRVDRGGAAHLQRVVPDGCADVLVAERVVVVGPSGQVALPELAPGTTVLGLRLRPAAIGAVFGLPACELRDRNVPLDDVVGPARAGQLAEALLEAGGAGSAAIGRWLSGVQVDVRLAAAVRGLLGGVDDVATVATAVGLSGRQLRRVLLADVGLGPKTLQRIGRFQRFLRLADRAAARGEQTALARWAAEAGYADQSHLTKDVTELAATTPARLVAERRPTGPE